MSNYLTIANTITLFRIILVPVFISVILSYTLTQDYLRWVALSIFLVAALSDALDGFVARRRNQKTEVGGALDSIADKLLIMSAFIFIFMMNDYWPVMKLPVWLVVMVISRDVIILLGYLLIFLFVGRVKIFGPTISGKITTFLQMLSVLIMLLQNPALSWMWWLVAFFTLVTTIEYIKRGIVFVNSEAKQ